MKGAARVALVGAALAMVACGSGSADPASEPAARQHLREVTAALKDVEASFRAGDASGVCARLSPAGRAQAARLAPRRTTCRAAIAALASKGAGAATEQRPFEVIGVTVKGRRATAMVSDGGRVPQPITLSRAGGRWKPDTVLLASPSTGP